MMKPSILEFLTTLRWLMVTFYFFSKLRFMESSKIFFKDLVYNFKQYKFFIRFLKILIVFRYKFNFRDFIDNLRDISKISIQDIYARS
jgi:hypothetical protein